MFKRCSIPVFETFAFLTFIALLATTGV